MDQTVNVGRFLSNNTMVWQRRFSVAPARLWDAIATKEGLSHWFMPTEFAIEEGGRFSFEGGWEGTVSAVRPYHHVQFDADGDGGGYLRFKMTVDNGACPFALIDRMGDSVDVMTWPDEPAHRIFQPGGPGTHWSGVAAGYHCFVDALEDHISGGQISSDYDEMCKKYRRILDDHFGRVQPVRHEPESGGQQRR